MEITKINSDTFKFIDQTVSIKLAQIEMETDRTIINIVKEIIRECNYKGIPVYENFVMYYVKLLALNPKWHISPGFVTHRTDVQQFINYIITKLENQVSPSIITLKMQFYFSCSYDNRKLMIKKNRMNLKTRLKPLEKEILEQKYFGSDKIEKYTRKLIYYLTLASGLGNPTIEKVYKEVEMALKSILNERELIEFVTLQINKKYDQLEEFIKLVTGIRLFNRDCAKGGEGIEDLPYILSNALEVTNSEFQKTLTEIMEKVNLLTTAIDYSYVTETKDKSYHISLHLPDGVESGDMEYIKGLLVVYRQYELYIRKLSVELLNQIEMSTNIFTTLQDTLINLHQTVQNKIAIPVNLIFPKFIELSDIWRQLQDETILLAKFNQIANSLHEYIKPLTLNEHELKLIIGTKGIMTDAQRLNKTKNDKIDEMENKVTILDPTTIIDLDRINFEYLGFCSFKLLETEGGLIPGNLNMGIAKIMNKYYVFSSVEAANVFGEHAERCIMRTLEMVRKSPELINLLQLREQLAKIQNIEELVAPLPDILVTHDVEIETETYPVQTKIDRKYTWNVWDLKREAIKLANISKCKTASTQTNKSTCRVAVRTQTYLPKEKNLQTKIDNFSNVPTLSNYTFGLRGRKNDKQHVITLTRPVDE